MRLVSLYFFPQFVVAPLQDGRTPLWIAAREGHINVVHAMVAGGASINQAKKVRGMVVR
jgi:ankyrin repeat protein